MADDTTRLLETVAVHIKWLRRPDLSSDRHEVDNVQSADYLERLSALLAERSVPAPQPDPFAPLDVTPELEAAVARALRGERVVESRPVPVCATCGGTGYVQRTLTGGPTGNLLSERCEDCRADDTPTPLWEGTVLELIACDFTRVPLPAFNARVVVFASVPTGDQEETP